MMARRNIRQAEGYDMIWTGGKGRGQIGYISWVYGLRKREGGFGMSGI